MVVVGARLTAQQELGEIQKSSDLCKDYEHLPLSTRAILTVDAPALAVACRDIDVRNVKAIIIGPSETPYEFGFFEVRLTPS